MEKTTGPDTNSWRWSFSNPHSKMEILFLNERCKLMIRLDWSENVNTHNSFASLFKLMVEQWAIFLILILIRSGYRRFRAIFFFWYYYILLFSIAIRVLYSCVNLQNRGIRVKQIKTAGSLVYLGETFHNTDCHSMWVPKKVRMAEIFAGNVPIFWSELVWTWMLFSGSSSVRHLYYWFAEYTD